MAKSNKIIEIEHLDSFVKDELSEEEWEGLLPRLREKYRVVREKAAAPTPAEAKDAKNN